MILERIMNYTKFHIELSWFRENHPEDPTLQCFIDVYADTILKCIDLQDIKTKPAWKFLCDLIYSNVNYSDKLILLFNEIHAIMYNEDDYCDYLSPVLYAEHLGNKLPYDRNYVDNNLVKVIKNLRTAKHDVAIKLLSACKNKLNVIAELISCDDGIEYAILRSDLLEGDYEIFCASQENKEKFLGVIMSGCVYNYKIHHWMIKNLFDTSCLRPHKYLTLKVKDYDYDTMRDYLIKSKTKVDFVELCFGTFYKPTEIINFIDVLDHIKENDVRPIELSFCGEEEIRALSLIKNHFNFTVEVFNSDSNKFFFEQVPKLDLFSIVHDISSLLYYMSPKCLEEYIQRCDTELIVSLNKIIFSSQCFSERGIILFFEKIIGVLKYFNKRVIVYGKSWIDVLHMTALKEIIDYDVIVPVVSDSIFLQSKKYYYHVNDKKKMYSLDIYVFYDDAFFIDSVFVFGKEFTLVNKISVYDNISDDHHACIYFL